MKAQPCMDCGKDCHGQRCKKCYVVQHVPTEAQKKGLKVGWKKYSFKKGNIPINNEESRFKKGHVTWNKGIKGEDSHWFGRKHNDETKEKCREARMNQVMVTESRQEWMLQHALDYKDIEFETHAKIFGEPDIFIKPNFCVFVDGMYWHDYPNGTERDRLVNKTLDDQGYEVIRYWQNEIVDDIENITLDLLTRISKE